MKKTLLIILTAMLLVSCKTEPVQNETVKSDDTVAAITTPAEMSQDEKPATENEVVEAVNWREVQESYQNRLGDIRSQYSDAVWALSPEERILHFLDALTTGNTDLVDFYTHGWGHEEYKNVIMTYQVLESETVHDEKSGTDSGRAKVTLNVTQSDCDTFPMGVHTYNIVSNYLPDPCFIQMTEEGISLSDNVPQSDDPKQRDAVLFSDYYLYWCMYESKESPDLDKLFELIKLDAYEELVYDRDGFTLKEFEQYMSHRFGAEVGGYPEIIEKLGDYYDADKEKYIYPYGQCADTLAQRISGVDKTEKGYKIHFEFYSDMSYIQKCADVTLTFEENENTDIMRLVDIDRVLPIGNVPRASYSA